MIIPRIMLTGLPASGKSTIASSVGDVVEVVNFANYMRSAGGNGAVDFGGLELPDRRYLQKKAAKLVGKAGAVKPLLVDGHMVVDTPQGFVPGLPPDAVSYLGLTAIVVVISTPDQIVGRMNKDPRYAKSNKTATRLSLHEKLMLAAVTHYAAESFACVETIENKDPDSQAAKDALREYLDRAWGLR